MIGIIGAMAEELAAVTELVDAHEVVELGGRRYHRGRDAVCVVSRIGKVAAAMTTAILIERFAPRAIVMTGVAGAVDPRLAIGDVVVADRLIHHDLDARPLFPRHEIPLLGTATLPTDRALSDRLADAVATIAPPSWLPAPRSWRGLVASGDQFFASPDATAALRARLPEALAVEMEGAAVAQVCYEHGVPFAIARVISDTANHAAAVDFKRFLTDACGPYARALVAAVLTSSPRTSA